MMECKTCSEFYPYGIWHASKQDTWHTNDYRYLFYFRDHKALYPHPLNFQFPLTLNYRKVIRIGKMKLKPGYMNFFTYKENQLNNTIKLIWVNIYLGNKFIYPECLTNKHNFECFF